MSQIILYVLLMLWSLPAVTLIVIYCVDCLHDDIAQWRFQRQLREMDPVPMGVIISNKSNSRTENPLNNTV